MPAGPGVAAGSPPDSSSGGYIPIGCLYGSENPGGSTEGTPGLIRNAGGTVKEEEEEAVTVALEVVLLEDVGEELGKGPPPEP